MLQARGLDRINENLRTNVSNFYEEFAALDSLRKDKGIAEASIKAELGAKTLQTLQDFTKAQKNPMRRQGLRQTAEALGQYGRGGVVVEGSKQQDFEIPKLEITRQGDQQARLAFRSDWWFEEGQGHNSRAGEEVDRLSQRSW